MPDRQSTVWVDANGITTVKLLTTTAGAAAVVGQLAAVSNAAVQESWEGTLTVVASPAPVASPFISVRDEALLYFQTAAGAIVKVSIPAPQSGIFMADLETVDPAMIAALITQVLADVVTPAGVALLSYVGGSRIPR